jgi:hypothetical protein|tara:strand:+ start:16160 stop:16708 length:549 start_codon:yes stop_codon:yes gene_type:complete
MKLRYFVLSSIPLSLLLIGCAQEQPIPKTNEVEKMPELKLTSPAFEDNGNIPSKYTCQGDGINPPLNIEGIPENAESLILMMDDPDAPAGTWGHWIVFNIPKVSNIDENSVPDGAVQGKNSWGNNNYGGPCPPSGTHRYMFKLYALDTKLELDESSDKKGVESAMQGHILAETRLVGLYSKG